MGITFGLLDRLRSGGMFAGAGVKVLDIGSSNLYQAQFEQVRDFVLHFRPAEPKGELAAFAARIAKGSGYDPVKGGLNESFVGELLERCGIGYLSFDIAEGYRTEVLDLNRERLPKHRSGAFDVVLNIGTTEHVLNQYNSFEVIHDAARVGGYMVHQLPVAGFTDHGYFLYTGRMFFDLAGFNKYEVVDLWYDGPAGNDDLFTSVRAYQGYFPKLAALNDPSVAIPNCALTIILRKTRDTPFTACLETSTSVGQIPSKVRLAYAASAVAKAATVGP